jgi:hypothetical protein
VNYAQGLPLALKVFGSLLFGRTMDEWKSARNLLKENPNAKILDKLEISYDGSRICSKKCFSIQSYNGRQNFFFIDLPIPIGHIRFLIK